MIKDGYKKTEIGVIPVEWEVVKFRDITKVRQGLQIPISKRKTEPCENCYQYITIQFVKNNKEIEYIENPQKSVIFGEDDVLMTRTGNTGIVITNVNGVFHNNFFLIDFDRTKISKDFLVFYLKSHSIQKAILLKACATTIPDLNHGDFYSINFVSPPLKEQKEIANILSTADKKIEAIDLQIQKAQTLKKGLLQKLLSEGIGHSEFKDSELGRIPIGWEVVLLPSVLLDEKKSIKVGPFGSQIKKEDLTVSGFKIYGQENVIENNFMIGNRYISKEKYKALKTNQVISGDIVITMMGTGGKAKVIPLDIEEGIMDSHLMRIRVNDVKIKNYFLSRLINEAYLVRKQIEKFSQGGIMSGLSKAIISAIKIPLPPLKEQKQIAQILSTADEKLELLRAKKEKYETLKKGLLQKLLSGEVRVGCCP